MKVKFAYIFIFFSFCLGCLVTVTYYSIGVPRDPAIYRPHPRDSKYKVVFIIFSAPQDFEKRDVMRETWVGLLKKHRFFKYFFIIGENDLSSDVKLQLFKEQTQHKDILFLPLTDSYYSLAKKLLLTLRVLHEEYKSEYVLKCDDDSYINVPHFLNAIQDVNDKSLYWGYFNGRASVHRRGKWKETEWFLCDRYLPYAQGGGYVLGEKIVQFLAQNGDSFSLYTSEDVSVGAWTAGLSITRHHDVRFNTQYVSRGCLNNYLILHKQSASDMKNLHSNLIATGKICETEFEHFRPYKYNWSVPPSQCCSNAH